MQNFNLFKIIIYGQKVRSRYTFLWIDSERSVNYIIYGQKVRSRYNILWIDSERSVYYKIYGKKVRSIGILFSG